MDDWLEGIAPMKRHVLIRFGMWEEILVQCLPMDEELYCVTTAMMRYARTVAFSNSGDIAGTKAEWDAFLAARDQMLESRMLFNNACHDTLGVAERMMLGELEYREGNHGKACNHLRESIELDDYLPYDEPWG